MVPKKCFESTDEEGQLSTICCRKIKKIARALADRERSLSERERCLNEKLNKLQDRNKKHRHIIDYSREVRQKAYDLAEKEHELLKKERRIDRKFNKLRFQQDRSIKKQLEAASKLKIARKQLFRVLDAKDKVKNYDKKKKVKKVKKRKKSKAKQNFTSKVYDCLLKSSRKRKKKKIKLISFFRNLLGNPCACVRPDAKKKLGPFSQRFGVLPCWRGPPRSAARRSRWAAAAGDCYLMSLRNPPHPWLYHRYPRFYPQYLSLRHTWRNLGYVLLFLAGIVFWTPLLLCLYLCVCLCCSDCH